MDIEDWQIRDYAGYNNINGAQDRDYDTSSAEYYAHRGCLATFYNCPKLKNVTLAEGIKLLMNRMFSFCIYNHRTTKTNQKYPSVNL